MEKGNAPETAKDASGPARSPTIRTMRSDVEELFRSTKPSLIQLMTQEAPPAMRRQHRRMPWSLVLSVVLLVVAGVTAGGIFFLIRTPREAAAPPALTPPLPFFATERSRTISVDSNNRAQFLRLMEDSRSEQERAGTVKRILIKVRDGPQERFATLADFFTLWRITPPQGFLAQIDAPLMVFIYYREGGNNLGFAVRTRDPDRTLRSLLSWEPSLPVDLKPLFGEVPLETFIAPFEDRIYRNIDWRYLKLSSDQDIGIGYTVFSAGNILVLTTGKEAMETVLARLFDAR